MVVYIHYKTISGVNKTVSVCFKIIQFIMLEEKRL